MISQVPSGFISRASKASSKTLSPQASPSLILLDISTCFSSRALSYTNNALAIKLLFDIKGHRQTDLLSFFGFFAELFFLFLLSLIPNSLFQTDGRDGIKTLQATAQTVQTIFRHFQKTELPVIHIATTTSVLSSVWPVCYHLYTPNTILELKLR